MRRVNSSRQTIAAKQRVSNYHPNYALPLHVRNATMEYVAGRKRPVILMQAEEAAFLGQVIVEEGEQFYLVASKFEHRYYVLKQDGTCSSSDERVADACRAKVEAFNLQKKAVA